MISVNSTVYNQNKKRDGIQQYPEVISQLLVTLITDFTKKFSVEQEGSPLTFESETIKTYIFGVVASVKLNIFCTQTY